MSEPRQRGMATAMVVCAGLLAVAAVIGGGWVREVGDAVRDDWTADRNPPVPAAPIVVSAGATEPLAVTVNDCDAPGAFFPCVTVTGTGWVVRWPNRADHIDACPAEDGGPVLPCVWTDPQAGSGEWIVYTDRVDLGTEVGQ